MVDSAKLQLYSYWRSSSSHRVRIALNLKGLEYEYKSVNLVKNEQSSPEFVKLNPLKYVPVLVDGDAVISDSFVISLYLEDKYPEHPLLPKDLKNKALNLQVASIVGSSIQPLHNLGVLKYIEEKLNSNEKVAWAQYHINYGFEALEKLLKDVAGKYATGDEVQLAEYAFSNYFVFKSSMKPKIPGQIIKSFRSNPGELKLNVDGCSKGNPVIAGAEGIIRDLCGRLVLVFLDLLGD